VFYYHHLSDTNPTGVIQKSGARLLKPGSKDEVLLVKGDFLVIGDTKILVDIELPLPDPNYIPTDPKPDEIE
jgi:hypothetical protein